MTVNISDVFYDLFITVDPTGSGSTHQPLAKLMLMLPGLW